MQLRRPSSPRPAAHCQPSAWPAALALFVAFAACQSPAPHATPGEPWARHVIDASSQGADGVRPADVNGDGLTDLATGWEEGGVVRAYLNPGPDKVREPWPAVTVGEVASPEDAVFADLDGDGAWDVISATEGRSRAIYFHWAPSDPARYLDAAAWTTERLPGSHGITQWMFALPADIDGAHGLDFFAGSKGEPAYIGWWQAPADARRLEDWIWRPLYRAGWIMSLIPHDVDGDGDLDLVASDRTGDRRGALWLENPGAAEAAGPWIEHRVGPVGRDEVMFMTVADLDQDGLDDMLVAVKDGPLLFYRRLPGASIDGAATKSRCRRRPAAAGGGRGTWTSTAVSTSCSPASTPSKARTASCGWPTAMRRPMRSGRSIASAALRASSSTASSCSTWMATATWI